MKAKIEIDCTPEELRRFLGLPDTSALQRSLEEGMTRAMGDLMKDPAACQDLVREWQRQALGATRQFQEMMGRFAGAFAADGSREEGGDG